MSFINRKDCVCLITCADSEGLNIFEKGGPLASAYYGGAYKLIDFALSGCLRSELSVAGILLARCPDSFREYIADGRAWGFCRPGANLSFLPSFSDGKAAQSYRGKYDAVRQNLDFIDHYHPKTILLLSAECVYFTDYRGLLAEHYRRRALATFLSVPESEAEKNPKAPAFLGAEVWEWKPLRRFLLQHFENTDSALAAEYLPELEREGKLCTLPHVGYWRRVGGVEDYWQGQMDLLRPKSKISFKLLQERLKTNEASDLPLSRLCPESNLQNALIGRGCHIAGSVRQSLLSRGVRVEKGAAVFESVLMPGCVVESGAQIYHSVLGPRVQVSAGGRIGDPFYNDKVNVIRGDTVVLRLSPAASAQPFFALPRCVI